VLLTPDEQKTMYVKFNERALLRGTLKDQAEFFAKALGSGGHSPWMSPNEVRELQDLAKSNDNNADGLQSPLMRNANVPAKAAGN
jgi:phage portal protein BeeE